MGPKNYILTMKTQNQARQAPPFKSDCYTLALAENTL